MKLDTFTIPTFTLESGETIENLNLSFNVLGTLNEEHTNIVWVFHALSANADVESWWSGLFGTQRLYDPSEYFIICANIIGSPYGSTCPTDMSFPEFTIRDLAQAQLLLAEALGIDRIHTIIGGSMGASQALEFSYSFSGKIENMVLLACAAKESPWGIAIHEAQRLALHADKTFGKPHQGKNGLKAARAMAMLGYRTSDQFIKTQQNRTGNEPEKKAASYIQYQGDKFVKRFDAICYYYLTNCLDSHDIGRSRGGVEKALSTIQIPTLVIGFESDILMPVSLQKELAGLLPNAVFKEITSPYGHDGFLVEFEKITEHILHFYQQHKMQSQKQLMECLGISA